jgi:photosystem II stability/assembly factor-like uncharacterized protein
MLALLYSTTETSPAATAPVTVSVNVPSAVQLTNYCTQNQAWNLGTVLPGSNALSSTDGAAASGSGVCRFDFQSSNDTAQLRIGQADGTGTAMSTRGAMVDTTGGTAGWWSKDFSSIAFGSTAGTGFAAQMSGDLWKTTDSGATWTDQSTTSGCNNSRMAASNDTTVYVVCAWGNAVRKGTYAAGWSWGGNMNHGAGGTVDSVASVSGTNTLWVCSQTSPRLRYTATANTDSGWTTVPNEAKLVGNCDDVYAVNTNVVWAGDNNGNVFKTTNGGANFDKVGTATGLGSVTKIFATDANHAWVVGGGASDSSATWTAYTTDGGATWTDREVASGALPDDRLYSIWATSNTDVYVFGTVGQLAYSADGGNTWAVRSTNTGNSLSAGAAFPGGQLVAVGNGATIQRSTDAGVTWSTRTTETTAPLGLTASSTDVAWWVGSNGLVKKTTNGGGAWSTEATPVSVPLYATKAASASVVWAVGAGGTIIKTSDGGATWTQQTSGTTQNLYAIGAASTTWAWAVGANGTILVTGDGGSTWTQQASGTTLTLSSVSVVSEQTAWIGGDEQLVLRTTNAGVTWSATASCCWDAVQISAVDANLAYATGGWGFVAKTTNGGTSWSTISTGSSTEYVIAPSRTELVVAGGQGANYISDDSGATWSNLATGDTQFYAVDANTIWAWSQTYGNEGAIDRMTPASSLPDIVPGATQWNSSATGAFGVCVQAVGLSASIVGPWVADTTNTPGKCTADNVDPWAAIPASMSKVANTASAGQSGRVDLVWGFRAGTTQAPGTYRATVLIDVLAPG